MWVTEQLVSNQSLPVQKEKHSSKFMFGLIASLDQTHRHRTLPLPKRLHNLNSTQHSSGLLSKPTAWHFTGLWFTYFGAAAFVLFCYCWFVSLSFVGSWAHGLELVWSRRPSLRLNSSRFQLVSVGVYHWSEHLLSYRHYLSWLLWFRIIQNSESRSLKDQIRLPAL